MNAKHFVNVKFMMLLFMLCCLGTVSAQDYDPCDLKEWTYVEFEACDSFIWQGNIYYQSRGWGQACEVVGTWSDDGCDSVACLLLTLHVNVRDTQDEVRYGCGSLIFNGVEYTKSGWATETKKGVAADGCDSIYYFPLEIMAGNAYSDTTVRGCREVRFNGRTYTADTSWEDVVSMGVCDSVSHVSISVQAASYDTLSISACDYYVFGGQTYYQDTLGPTVTFSNLAGCDSIVTLNLTIHHSVVGDTSATACDSITWYGTTYYGGNPTHLFRNATTNGCDSTVRLNIEMRHDTHADTMANACDSFYWHGQMLYRSSEIVAADQLEKNAQGCDSTLRLILTIYETVTSDSAVIGCNSVVWNDSVYVKETVADTHRYVSSFGCDSVVKIRIVLQNQHAAHDTAIACGHFIWHYTMYTESGVYSYHTYSVRGCDSITYLHLTIFPRGEGELSGSFEVEGGEEGYDPSDSIPGHEALKKYNGRYVSFSQGNLQYTNTSSLWRFAEHQFDYIGQGNKYAGEDYVGWIDLFGWGTSGYHNPFDVHNTAYQPWSTNNENVDYLYNSKGYGPSVDMEYPDLTDLSANYDWGIRNPISNGENKPGIWRTMTYPEWDHLLYHRRDAANKRAQATITNISGGVSVRGVVLLPESWIQPDNSTFVAGSENGFLTNVYTIDQWETMQTHGAAFLPAAGNRFMYIASGEEEYGYYWSASHYDADNSYLFVLSAAAMLVDFYPRHIGRSVRLVQDDALERRCTVYIDTLVYADSIVWNGLEITEEGDYQNNRPKTSSDECDTIETLHFFFNRVGIDNVQIDHSKVFVQGRNLVVRGTEGQVVRLYDMQGRLLDVADNHVAECRFTVSNAGVYMVRVGYYPAHKIVVR